MKVKYIRVHKGIWYWEFGTVVGQTYSRRSDAVRGFERHCAAIRGMK
jgi:hypothetical protein